MGSRYEVEVTIISANDLKNVNWRHGRLKPYAVAWVEERNKSVTQVDEEGHMHPNWDRKLVIPFNSPIHDSHIYIDIVHAKAADGIKPHLGSTWLPLRNVLDLGKGVVKTKLQLVRKSGRPHGNVHVKVAVRELMPYHHAQPYGVPIPVPQSYTAYSAAPPPPPYGGAYSTAPPAAPYPAGPVAGCPYYGQPARVSYGQPGGYGQVGQQSQGAPVFYGQPGGYGQVGQQSQGAKLEPAPVSYGQPGGYGQDGYQSQGGKLEPAPVSYGQPGGYEQDGQQSQGAELEPGRDGQQSQGAKLDLGAVADVLDGVGNVVQLFTNIMSITDSNN